VDLLTFEKIYIHILTESEVEEAKRRARCDSARKM